MTEQLKPLSIGELLDRTFFLYRKHFVLFVGIAAIPSLFRIAVQVFLVGGTPEDPGALFTLFIALASMFLFLMAGALTQAATVVAVSQLHLGRETSIAESFAAIRPRLGEFMVLILNMGLRIVIGFLFFIVPGILLALRYSLTLPVAVVEGKTVSESLKRSTELTVGHRGRIFVIYLLLIALIVVVSLLWEVPVLIVTSIVGATGTMFGLLLAQLGGLVTQSLLGPIATIALALVYYDERVRKEAFDLEHMMQHIDRVAPSSQSAPA